MQSQESIRFKRCHFPCVPRAVACPVLHMVADGEVLPLGMHPLGAWTTGVVKVVPGVPPSTIPTHLDQPRPDLIRWCVDCDGHRRPVGYQPGTGVRPGDFLIGCAPAHEPRAHPASITDRCHGGHRRDPNYQLHTANVRGSHAALQGTNVTTRPTKFPAWPRGT